MTHDEFLKAVNTILTKYIKPERKDLLVEIYETWSSHKATNTNRLAVYRHIVGSFDWNTVT